jgi:hypothetical protein
MDLNFYESFFNLKFNSFQKEFLTCNSNKIIIKAGRQVGKSTILAIYAIIFAIQNDRSSVIIVSPSLRQSLLLFQKVLTYSQNLSFYIEKTTQTMLKFKNGSQIKSFPQSNKIRGESADLIIVDECAFIDEDFLNFVVLPMGIARKNTRLVLSSTPSIKNATYKFIWDNLSDWYKISIASNEVSHINQEFLESYKKLVNENTFRQEILGQFVNQDSIFFIEHSLKPIENLNPNLTLIDLGGKSNYMGVLYANESEILSIISEIQEFTQNYTEFLNNLPKFGRVLYDKTGIGQSLQINGQGVVWNSKNKLSAIYDLKIAFDTSKIFINSNCKRLIEQLRSFELNKHTPDLLSALLLYYAIPKPVFFVV